MKILVTGGPVHAHLDAVKIITNKFQGGLMAALVDSLLKAGHEVTYVTSKSAALPKGSYPRPPLEIVWHNGIDDYRLKVLQLAPKMNAVVLGAAVANLIPQNPLVGKFPSHNYKPGQTIPINFVIAPRIIDEVKQVAPNTTLIGFKYLKGVPHEELISAAYGVLLDSKATVVFANDGEQLSNVFMVTKERAVIPMSRDDIAQHIINLSSDLYYHTRTEFQPQPHCRVERLIAAEYIQLLKDKFVSVENGMLFGTVAVRVPSGGFITTGRGKKELDNIVHVTRVDHEKRNVWLAGELFNARTKATLNAPLLDTIFSNPMIKYILHYHEQHPLLPTLPYAPSGTVRDSERKLGISFNIKGHGCYLLLDDSETVLGTGMPFLEFLKYNPGEVV